MNLENFERNIKKMDNYQLLYEDGGLYHNVIEDSTETDYIKLDIVECEILRRLGEKL